MTEAFSRALYSASEHIQPIHRDIKQSSYPCATSMSALILSAREADMRAVRPVQPLSTPSGASVIGFSPLALGGSLSARPMAFAVTGGKNHAPDPAPTKRCISPTANPNSAESGDGSRRANTSAKLA